MLHPWCPPRRLVVGLVFRRVSLPPRPARLIVATLCIDPLVPLLRLAVLQPRLESLPFRRREELPFRRREELPFRPVVTALHPTKQPPHLDNPLF